MGGFCCSSKSNGQQLLADQGTYSTVDPYKNGTYYDGWATVPVPMDSPFHHSREGTSPWCCSRLCCCCSCRCFCCCSTLLILLLGWIFFLVMTAECAVAKFAATDVLPANAQATGVSPPVEIGTTSNMNVDPALGIDLTGLWWMDGNPFPEYFVSFAGGFGTSPFPTHLKMPTNMERHWTWPDTIIGRGTVAYYAFTSSVDTQQVFHFFNKSYAEIVPIAKELFEGKFIFEDGNDWDDHSWNRGTSYTLRRVIQQSGNATVYWQKFLDFYKDAQPDGMMIAYSSNNGCLRRCQYFLPCGACDIICKTAE